MKRTGKKSDSSFKEILISLMIPCFSILAVKGLVKFRGLMNLLNISYERLPMKQITYLHEWSALVFILLVIIHLVFQKKWFFRLKFFFFILSASAAVIIIIILISAFPTRHDNAAALESAEIREYNGENLSLISEFRENSIRGPQNIDIKKYRLKVGGLVKDSLSLKYDDVLKYNKYSKVITLHCVEGWSAKILWEGILLKDLFDAAGADKEADTVIFYAQDGYSSSLPLSYVLDNNILLAYEVNGVTLPPERGFPFQVAAEDKWGYKWVRWVTEIKLSDDPEYKGYWEKAGYNQDGDVAGPLFE